MLTHSNFKLLILVCILGANTESDINKKYAHWIFNSFCFVLQAAGCLNEEVRQKRLGVSGRHIYAFLSKCNYKLH